MKLTTLLKHYRRDLRETASPDFDERRITDDPILSARFRRHQSDAVVCLECDKIYIRRGSICLPAAPAYMRRV